MKMPSSQIFAFRDPFPYQAAIRAADWEIFPTTKGEFRAELTQINLNKLWMQRLHETLPQVQVGTLRPGRKVIGFLTDVHQRDIQHRGANISPCEIVTNSDVMHIRSAGNSRCGGMSLTDDDFDAACQALMGGKYEPSPYKHVVRPSPYLMTRLRTLHEIIGQMAKATPDILELTEVARSLEQQLIHLMVRCLTEGEQPEISGGGRRHNIIVLRLEELLEANHDRPLYLTEICAALNTAERTLRVACVEHLGMGPIRYLSLRRMHLVRRALLRADPVMTTVTRVATDHGFWELGRFSVSYRNLFGESPSETLRRPVQDKPERLRRPSSLAGVTYQ
ncbi:helix-turn-helix domain-containing protein [Bradyrhizobium sp. Pha-3]|uniref:helix-turn-helix domain-containing protein n=1 Tax=Bradyrhizobium sp. Pha-3 TaxID=208375 RepID=UPI0035D4BF39